MIGIRKTLLKAAKTGFDSPRIAVTSPPSPLLLASAPWLGRHPWGRRMGLVAHGKALLLGPKPKDRSPALTQSPLADIRPGCTANDELRVTHQLLQEEERIRGRPPAVDALLGTALFPWVKHPGTRARRGAGQSQAAAWQTASMQMLQAGDRSPTRRAASPKLTEGRFHSTPRVLLECGPSSLKPRAEGPAGNWGSLKRVPLSMHPCLRAS